LLQCLDESLKVFETASLAVKGVGYVRPYTGTVPVLVLDWQVLLKDSFVM